MAGRPMPLTSGRALEDRQPMRHYVRPLLDLDLDLGLGLGLDPATGSPPRPPAAHLVHRVHAREVRRQWGHRIHEADSRGRPRRGDAVPAPAHQAEGLSLLVGYAVLLDRGEQEGRGGGHQQLSNRGHDPALSIAGLGPTLLHTHTPPSPIPHTCSRSHSAWGGWSQLVVR